MLTYPAADIWWVAVSNIIAPLSAAQCARLLDALQRLGRTVVPLQACFNEKGRATLEIALALDKKERDWQRQRSRLQNRT